MSSTGGDAAASCGGAAASSSAAGASRAPPSAAAATSSAAARTAAAKAIYVFANEKGGMKDLDTDAIHRIILECSSDSAYTARQLRQDKKVDAAVAAKRALLTDDGRRRGAERVVAQRVGEFLRAASYNSRCFCVVDFDMFYAAVEIRDKPGLAQLPVAVGGIGMISTANYVARRWGVRSAMPGFVGQQLCRRGPEFGMPKAELVFVKPDFEKYTAVAEIARAIFREYDPRPRAGSLDEATLDLTAYLQRRARLGSHDLARFAESGAAESAAAAGAAEAELLGDGDGDEEPATAWDDDAADGAAAADGPVNRALAEEVVHEIRERVAAATGGLTSSAGIGHSRMAAKVAADIHKPNGQHCAGFSHDEVLAFLGPLSVRKLPGVGRVLEKELSEVLGVTTIAELRAELPRVFVAFSEGCADFLLRASHGGGDGAADDDADGDGGHQKGISCERTFAATSDAAEHRAIIGALSATLASQLAERGLRGGGVTLKLKTAAFDLLTRESSRGGAVATEAQVRERALALYERELRTRAQRAVGGAGGGGGGGGAAADEDGLRLRLIGVRVGKLSSTAAPDEADGGQLRISRFLGEGGAAAADALGGGGGTRARFDASEIDESVLAELPLEVQREVRAEIAAARAPPPQPPRAADAKRPAAAPAPAGGRRAAKRHAGGAQQPTLAAFVSGNGGANGGGASGGASNPMAEAFRSRGRTGPLAGGARSGGGGPVAAAPRESHDDALSRLLAMGFGRAAGEAALAAAGGDAQRAVEALLQ